jgi:hypothetical protein
MSNQGYYNWIHDLKNAANTVQHNHAKLLSEAQQISGETGLKQGQTSIGGRTRPGTIGQGSAENEIAGRIAKGIFDLIQTVNTGVRPTEQGEGSGNRGKGTLKNPNPALKPSEALKIGEKGARNIAKAAAAQAYAIGQGEAVIGPGSVGREDFEALPDTPSPGPMSTLTNRRTYDAMARLRRMQTPNRTPGAENAMVDATPDLRPVDVDGDGDADAFDVSTDAQDGRIDRVVDVNVSRVPKFSVGDEPSSSMGGMGSLPTPVGREAMNAATAAANQALIAQGLGAPQPAPRSTVSAPAPTRREKTKKAVSGLKPDTEGRVVLPGGRTARVVTRGATNESVSDKINKFFGA